MTAIDRHLFEQFADALDAELAQAGTDLRVARNRSSEPGTMILQDACGGLIGPLPDHVDAATIVAIENLLETRKRTPHRH